MKTLKSLKLNQLSKAKLKNREMNSLLGAGTPGCCNCGCGGPSSTGENMRANSKLGYTITEGDSIQGCTYHDGCWECHTS
jgi:natural product precursor